MVRGDLDFRRLIEGDGVPGHTRWSHYLPTASGLRDSGLCCRGVGEQTGPQRPMRRRHLSCHALVFVTAGSGSYLGTPGSGPQPVTAPALIWLFPGVSHTYGPHRSGWDESWVLFEGSATRAYESQQAWRREEPVVDAAYGLAAEIGPVFERMRVDLAVPGRRAAVMGASLSHALIGIAAGHTLPSAAAEDRPAAVDAVVASALDNLAVTDRARAAGLSPDGLRRQVREQTGLSVHELVIQTRLGRAQGLLAGTAMDVATVARQVGYDDPAYFSRLFRERVGVPPTEFRAQQGR